MRNDKMKTVKNAIASEIFGRPNAIGVPSEFNRTLFAAQIRGISYETMLQIVLYTSKDTYNYI